jgi:hypothetical protein
MAKPYIPGGIALKYINNQKGSAMFWGLMLMFIGTIIIAGITYVGNLGVYRVKTQTATDAAALASAGSDVKRWVDITVITKNREELTTCCDEDSCWPCCSTSCGEDTYINVKGEEKDLIEARGWRNYCRPCECGGDCSLKINHRWVEYNTANKTTTRGAAVEFYKANLPKGAIESAIKKITVYNREGHPAYPSVVVYATTSIDTMFASLFPAQYETTTCSQASTYYKMVESGKKSRPPKDWCWKDW